jgi:CRP-like cAMP-binding protein
VLLRFFRINDPYRLLGILVILILIALPLFIDPVKIMRDELKMFVLGETLNQDKGLYTEVLTNTPPLFALISGWFEMIFGRSQTAERVFSLILIFFQLSFFTIILINCRAHNESTYLPGLIFGTLAFFSFDMLSFSSELMASTVLLFALNNLFKEVEFRVQRDEIVLNLGVYIGLTSLLVFSYALYLPGVLIILGIFTRLTLRKSFLVIFGFMLPHAFVIVRYYMMGNVSVLYENFYRASFTWQDDFSLSLSSVLLLCLCPAIFLLLSLFTLNREARLTKYQSQLSQIMILWTLLAVVEVAISGSLKPHQLITCIPPLAYFISHYILVIRRKVLAEVTIWTFIITVISLMYLSRYEVITNVNYHNLFPPKSPYTEIKDKRVLILGDDWGLLTNNKPASGFYDWKMVRPIFTDLDYFENVVLIDKAFNHDEPEVILDQENKMNEVFKRIPSIQSHYSREGSLYIRK